MILTLKIFSRRLIIQIGIFYYITKNCNDRKRAEVHSREKKEKLKGATLSGGKSSGLKCTCARGVISGGLRFYKFRVFIWEHRDSFTFFIFKP